MTDINHVLVIGRLTRDFGADPRTFFYTTGGTACAKVSIAVNRSVKQSDGQWTDEVSFFDVTIWGKTAENLKPYLVKGKQIAVDGYLKQDRWQKDGQNFSKVNIVANSVQLLGGGNAEPESAPAPQPQNYGRNYQRAPEAYRDNPPQVPPRVQGNYTPPQTYQTPAPQQQFGGGDDFPEDLPF